MKVLYGVQGWRIVLTVDRTEERLTFERHLFKVLWVWVPFMPLVANGIVALKKRNPINFFICPLRPCVCDRLCKNQHGASGTGIILPQR